MVLAVFSEDFLHSHGHHILWPLLVHDWINPHRHHIRWPLLVYDWIQNCDSKQCAVTSVNLRGMKHQSGSQRLLLLYARYTMVLRVHDWIRNSASKQCAVDKCGSPIDPEMRHRRGSCHCPIVSIWLTFTASVTIVAVSGIMNMTTANTYYILHSFSHELCLVVLQIAWIQYKSRRHWVLHGTVLSIVSDTLNN